MPRECPWGVRELRGSVVVANGEACARWGEGRRGRSIRVGVCVCVRVKCANSKRAMGRIQVLGRSFEKVSRRWCLLLRFGGGVSGLMWLMSKGWL